MRQGKNTGGHAAAGILLLMDFASKPAHVLLAQLHAAYTAREGFGQRDHELYHARIMALPAVTA